MISIFFISLKDFLTKKFIILSLLPLAISLLVFGGFMIFGGSELFSVLSDGAKSGDYSFLNEVKYPLVAKILTYSVTKWVISAIFYVAGTFLVLMLSVFTALLVAGFLTPIVTKDINAKYYRLEKSSEVPFWRTIKIMLVVLLKFIGILLLCLPLLFVPVVNLFVINIPFFYLYYQFLLVDVASNALNAQQFEHTYKKGGGYSFIFACIGFYIVCLVPILGLVFQLFFVIYLSHILYIKEQKISQNRFKA